MKTTTKTTKVEQQIQKLNAAYQAATPAQRRVMIAKDALAQIAAKRYIPTSGTWCEVRDKDGDEIPYNDDPLQPILHQPQTQCDCCGVGAIFLSYVRFANKATTSDGMGYTDIRHITDWPADNLRLIELAFEHGHGCHTAHNYDEDIVAQFADGEDETGRLQQILRNIIKNHGTFKP